MELTDETVSVIDTGSGMSLADQAKAMQAFVRGDNAAGTHGYGWGLSLVKRICTALDFTLELESSPGAGSTFRVRFPDARD